MYIQFSYGHQKWAITFSRHDKTLGVYLVWKNPSDGMKTFVDFTITLLNLDHFTQNQSFNTKNAKFTPDDKSKFQVHHRGFFFPITNS